MNTLPPSAPREPSPPGAPTSNVGYVLAKAGVAPPPEAAARRPRPGGSARVANFGVVLFLAALVVVFSIWLPGKFPTWSNVQVILGDNAIPGLLALAVVVPLAAGEFDLSVGATLGFSAILTAYLTIHGFPVPLAILAAILTGAVIGAVNSFLVVRIGVNAFIATLGVATILAGLNLLVSGGATLLGIPLALEGVSQNALLGLPMPVWYFLGAALLLWYLLEHTPFGRLLRATGLGREAARLTGVSTKRFLASSFIIAGAIAGLCGALQTGRIGSATASIGPEFLLPAYAAAFLGSTTIRRGMFNVWGTVIGVLILAVGITGLTLAGAPFWVPDVFNGGALILAVSTAVLVGRHGGDT